MRADARIHNVIQGSEEWLRVRTGIPTASRISEIITPAKGEYSKSAEKYAIELIADSMGTDQPPEFAGNKWTDRGTELEPLAREALEQHTGEKVMTVGFITSCEDMVGCSPDGMKLDSVGMDYVRGCEIKCPGPKKHVQTFLGGVLPDDYRVQVHASMVITGLDEWEFFSWCPGIRPFHIIVRRDEFTAKVEAAMSRFLIEYMELRRKLMPLLTPQAPEI